jgi:ubiquitin C-terminal hydrolase
MFKHNVAHKSIILLDSSYYLIIHLKRFKQIYGAAYEKNKKYITLNDKISIKNNLIEKNYSLISIVHYLGNNVFSGHYICQSLINNVWYKFNDDVITTCDPPKLSTSCYITLWKLIENNLQIINNNMNIWQI